MVSRQAEDDLSGEPNPGSPPQTDSTPGSAALPGGSVHPCAAPGEDRGAVVRRLRHLIPTLERSGGGPVLVAPFGVPEIDGCLPAQGLARGVLHEAAPVEGEDAAATLGFALAQVGHSLRGSGSLVLVLSRRALPRGAALYGPGLAGLGVDPRRVALVEARNDRDALWGLEEVLRSRAVDGVVGAIGKALDLKASRRLHLAASASEALFLLLRPPDGAGASAAATRWRIGSEPAGRDRFGLIETSRWHIALERNRNGRGGAWRMEWEHGAHRFGVVGTMADRAPAAHEGWRRRTGAR